MKAALYDIYGPADVVRIGDIDKPLIDRSCPLDKIVDAYRFVETGEKVGNVVIFPIR